MYIEFSSGSGILQMVYEFLYSFFRTVDQQTNLSAEALETLNATGYYASIIMAIFGILSYAVIYVLLTVTFVKGYKNKGYNNLWLCYIPIVHICCFVQLIEAEKVWKMSKKLLTGILMGIIGVYALFTILKDLTFFNDIFTYWGGGNISLETIKENYTSVDKQGLLYSYYEGIIGLTTLAGFIFFFFAVLLNYYKTRTNKLVLCMVGSILLPELAFAIMALVLVNKKAQPKVVYTYYQAGQYPFVNPNQQTTQTTQQEPFSEFSETKKQEPFSEFNATQETGVDYTEQTDIVQEKSQENTQQDDIIQPSITDSEPQQEQILTENKEDDDEDDLF